MHSGRARSDWLDKAAAMLVWLAAGIIFVLFVWIVVDLLRGGLPHVSWGFLVESPLDGGRAGGIGPILVSTLLILAVCLSVSLPIGLGTAVLLAEFTRTDGGYANLVRRSLEVLAGVPSIVFGLFGNAFFSIYLGMGFSILAGGLTLACMVLPILIRAIEDSLHAVPRDYRRAAAALGLTQTTTLARIVLPCAVPGIVVGLALGVGRALAETAALLFTSGYVDRMPGSLMDSGRALSIHIYDLTMNVPGGDTPAYAAALVLLVLLLGINGFTAAFAHRWFHGRVTAA